MALMPIVEDLIEERGITVISDLQTMKSIPEVLTNESFEIICDNENGLSRTRIHDLEI